MIATVRVVGVPWWRRVIARIRVPFLHVTIVESPRVINTFNTRRVCEPGHIWNGRRECVWCGIQDQTALSIARAWDRAALSWRCR